MNSHRSKAPDFVAFRCGAHPPPLVLLAVSLTLAGCGITGAKSSASPTQTPIISVSIMQAPPSTLSVGTTASVSATVTDDPASAGVDWIAMCASVPVCGSFSPYHTASGAATTFTAPSGVPAGKTVSVTAQSATDHSKASAASVTITSTVTAVTITLPPPSTFPSGGGVSVAATVAGDPANEGVDWKATCGTIDCTSSFQGAHSQPGATATFLVPLPSLTYPMIVGSTVTLTAFATADHTFSTSAMFTVTDPISINITQAPPSTVPTNASVPLIAAVTNDPTNSGVTWTIVSCDASPCGSWSTTAEVIAIQAASGATVTYTAPPTAVNHVIIKAAATAGLTDVFTTVEISITTQISIAITQKIPNNSIPVNKTALIAATVSLDSANAGVDWTVTCASNGACGSFAPTHTASGAATTFSGPAAVPTGNTVTITATSTSDKSKTALQIVNVTTGVVPDSLLYGNWVILLTGRDANGGPFALGGVIVGDGAGKIIGGGLDLEDLGSGGGAYNAGNVGISPSLPAPQNTYSIGADGRGQIQLTMNTGNLNGSFGVNGSGSIVLSVVFVTPNHALVSESDSFGSGTGTLDLQNANDLKAFQNHTLSLGGPYSIFLTGAEVSGSNPPYFIAGALTFSGFSETAYITDQLDNGATTSVPYTPAPSGSSFTVPDNLGRMVGNGTFTLGVPPNQFNLGVWLIDANHFVVTDIRDLFFVTPSVIISGYMVAQPASATISGRYAFTESARTAAPSSIPQAAGGIFTCASTGTLDVTALGGTPVTNAAINAACTAPTNGRGLITLSGVGATTTGISKFAAYPTLDQGLYLIELDGGSAGTSGPSGTGVARQQTSPITVSDFSGKYASNFRASTSLGLEAFAGQIDSDGVSMLSGITDVNSFNITVPPLGNPSLNSTLSGSFTAGTNGRFPLTLTITPAAGQPVPEFTNINPACYIVDANTCLLLGLDANAPGTGILQLQNTGL